MSPIESPSMMFLSTVFIAANAIVAFVYWRGRRVQPRFDDEFNENLIWQYRNRINQPRLKQEPEKVKEK